MIEIIKQAIEDYLKNLIRVGVVSSVNIKKGSAKVYFEDRGMVSGELSIIYKWTMKNKEYSMPAIGEQVVCIFLGNGLEKGFILGATYNKQDTTPVQSKDKRHFTFDDGTVIEYDIETHKLTANVNGTAEITAETITINGDVILNGNLTVSGSTITGGGINLNTHRHPESIGSITGVPQ